jgi:glycerophosphoryl diester phosphodiesterase
MKLRSSEGGYLRVGHKGAAALAPENTIASLRAALAEGVDIVEFDVTAAPAGLVLAHSAHEIPEEPALLDEALAYLAKSAPPEVGLDLDLKSFGYEEEIVRALRRHGLTGKTLVCSVFPDSLRVVKELEPELSTGLSYPYDRRGVATRPLLAPAVTAGIAALRRTLPYRIAGMLGRARADAVMLEHRVLSRSTVERCHRLGVAVFAWTIDDPVELERVVATGIDGVISNDPRILRR